MASTQKPLTLSSVHLMAPACTVEFFYELYAPFIGAKNGGVKIQNLFVYNLSAKRELDDVVGPEILNATVPLYFKSLLYLVSNAFEERSKQPLAGMQIFEPGLKGNAKIAHAGIDKTSDSESHGGFDNDPATMNTILANVLGQPAPQPFKPEELKDF